MNYVTGLRCRECGRQYPAEALHVCDFCFGPLEVDYDYERIAAAISPERIAAGTPDDLALLGPAAGRGRHPGRPRGRVHPPRAGRPPGRRARAGRAVDQRRHGQSDRVVQGPGRLGGVDQGPSARLQGGRLRVDRQPGQLGGRPRGPGRDGLDRPHPRGSGGGQGHHDGRLRRHRGRGEGQLRRCQPAVRRAGQRKPLVGVRERERPDLLRRGLQDPRLRGGRAAGLAGPRPRGGADRLGKPARPRWPRGSPSWSRSG